MTRRWWFADSSVRGTAVRVSKVAAGLLGVALAVSVIYQGLTRGLGDEPKDPVSAYEVYQVRRGDLREIVVATGSTEPVTRVVVQSQVPGIVAAVYVDDGDSVERGMLLVELDRDRMEHRVAELEAALQMERARASQDLVGRADAEDERAQLDLARAEQLHENGILSIQRLDDARHAARLAGISAADARAGKSVRVAAVHRAEEELRRARSDLSKSIIRSPIDGVVVRRGVEVGTAVADLQNGGTVVAVLADDRFIHLRAEVSESDIARVQLGQRAEIRVDAFPEETVEGTVRKISSSGTLNRGASDFEIEVELAADPRLRVGMTADARIIVSEHRDVLLVPTRGIISTSEGPRVRVLSKGSRDESELRPIRTVYSDGFQAVVTKGLSEGDRLLVRSP